MNEKFDSRKAIITGAGVIIFLIVGMLAMFLIPSDSDSNANKLPVQPEKISVPVSDSVPVIAEKISTVPQKSDLFIYVTGAVNKPGVYKLSADSRIFKAIEAAGGFSTKADKASINLAKKLMDGTHIHVEQKGAAKPTPPQLVNIPGVQANNNLIAIPLVSKPANNNNNSNKNLVDVNKASAEELQKLNGIGPALAKRIIEYRQAHGRFTKPDDLIQVKGIGPAKLKKMREQILIR